MVSPVQTQLELPPTTPNENGGSKRRGCGRRGGRRIDDRRCRGGAVHVNFTTTGPAASLPETPPAHHASSSARNAGRGLTKGRVFSISAIADEASSPSRARARRRQSPPSATRPLRRAPERGRRTRAPRPRRSWSPATRRGDSFASYFPRGRGGR